MILAKPFPATRQMRGRVAALFADARVGLLLGGFRDVSEVEEAGHALTSTFRAASPARTNAA